MKTESNCKLNKTKHHIKKLWTSREDVILKNEVEKNGAIKWSKIAAKLPGRTSKQCRERFHNHLDIGLKKGNWSEDEDRTILTMQSIFGNQWAIITKQLSGRTDSAVKNRFHVLGRMQTKVLIENQARLLHSSEISAYQQVNGLLFPPSFTSNPSSSVDSTKNFQSSTSDIDDGRDDDDDDENDEEEDDVSSTGAAYNNAYSEKSQDSDYLGDDDMILSTHSYYYDSLDQEILNLLASDF